MHNIKTILSPIWYFLKICWYDPVLSKVIASLIFAGVLSFEGLYLELVAINRKILRYSFFHYCKSR